MGVVDRLSRPESRGELDRQNRSLQEKEREVVRGAGSRQARLLRGSPAPAVRPRLERQRGSVPSFLGVRSLADFPLAEIVPFIDWSPFFMSWELKGKYPAILDDPMSEPRPATFSRSTALHDGRGDASEPMGFTGSSRPIPTAMTW